MVVEAAEAVAEVVEEVLISEVEEVVAAVVTTKVAEAHHPVKAGRPWGNNSPNNSPKVGDSNRENPSSKARVGDSKDRQISQRLSININRNSNRNHSNNPNNNNLNNSHGSKMNPQGLYNVQEQSSVLNAVLLEVVNHLVVEAYAISVYCRTLSDRGHWTAPFRNKARPERPSC